jgi:hypothetical protein
MKSYQIMLFAAMLALSACSFNTNKTSSVKSDSTIQETSVKAIVQGVIAELSIKDTIKTGDSVLLKFTVRNLADTAQQFCKWHTPFEPLMSKYLEIVNEAGVEADYKGAMAKRIMPPPASSYIKLNSKDTLSANVDLLKGFAITKPGKYTVTYVGQNMSGLVVNKSISFVYLK